MFRPPIVSELADVSVTSETLGAGWFDELTRRKFMQGVAALEPTIAQAEETTIRIFTNGKLPTVDRAFNEADAITIRGKQITAVGGRQVGAGL
ncbi:MAG: hypothetical protein ACR2RV_16020 [Verrucomicrobiales bacterium]